MLQKLIRGRAVQIEMQEEKALNLPLIRELQREEAANVEPTKVESEMDTLSAAVDLVTGAIFSSTLTNIKSLLEGSDLDTFDEIENGESKEEHAKRVAKEEKTKEEGKEEGSKEEHQEAESHIYDEVFKLYSVF